MYIREVGAWGLAIVLGRALFAEETRVVEATKLVRGYQEMAERVEEHNRKAIQRTIELYTQRPTDESDD